MEMYAIEEGKLLIHDPELGLAIEEPFHSQLQQTFNKEKHLLSECHYLEGVLHGPSKFYGPNGELLSISWFYKGHRHGKMLQYYQSGALYSRQSFVLGQRTGRHLYYYPDGTLRTEIPYSIISTSLSNKNLLVGLMDGEMKLYWPSGILKRSVFLVKGKKNGTEMFYAEDGAITEAITHGP